MTLDIAAYLASALKAQGVFAEDDLKGVIPDAYRITLRYGVFGSFYGCGPRRTPWQETLTAAEDAPPAPPQPPGSHFLLNVMLVAERMD